MGITVHFEGRLKDEAALDAVIAHVEQFAQRRLWPVRPIAAAQVILKRVVNEANSDYEGPTRGVEVQPHVDSEPLRFEFDRDLFVQEYCKTQFAGLQSHMEIVDLLRELEAHFLELRVEDEGEYWESGDKSKLARHFAQVEEMIGQILREHPKASSPVRLPSGRIVDVIT